MNNYVLILVVCFLLLQMAFLHYLFYRLIKENEENEERILYLEMRVGKLENSLKKRNK